MDFLAETDDTLINIELQQQNTSDFKDRIAYYLSKLTRLDKGSFYNIFKKVLIVNIVKFKMNDLPHYKQEYKIVNIKDPTDIFTEKIHIITIELKKFRKIEKNLNNKEHLYLTFIDEEAKHEKRKEMGKMDEGLESAVKRIEEVLQSEEELRIYHKIQLEKTIMENEKLRTEEKIKKQLEKGLKKGLKKGLEEGKKEGRKEGIEERNIEIATKLKKIGLNVEEIAKITELSMEYIEKL